MADQLRGAVASVRATTRVAWLALRAYRNPGRTARALGRAAAALRVWSPTAPERTWRWNSRRCVRSSGRSFWDLYVPGFPSPAFDRWAEVELNHADAIGPPRIQTAIVAITRRCALACEHCFESDALNRPEALSIAELRAIVDGLQAQGASQIFFSGGEPMQRFTDLLQLVAAASPKSDAWILTSGRGLTADRIRRLRDAGLTGVSLSLDHWDPSAHDRFRGTPGTFDAVGRASAHARAAGLLVALSLCPTRSFVTAANLERYGETARSLGAAFIQIFEPRSVGRYAGQDVALEPSHLRLLEAFSAGHPGVRYLDLDRRTFGCRGGIRYVYVDTAGTLHACPFCRENGVPAVGTNMTAAFATLRTAGCSAGRACPSTTGASL